ncbi:MAG: addiction module toxin RelE [Mediterranea sp.]|jgi:mRNA-degrading endonuclease RelE of RelBE toxin-antitoxin system|nr:addiction module toxin RelE [Mediterranea sp.]
MNYKITYSPRFGKELKRLSKHYKSLKSDYANLLASLKQNPTQGISLGNNLRKVRMAITSKSKGKSGGARVITYTVILTEVDAEIKLLAIYDKSERAGLSDKEMRRILEENGL